MNISYNWLRKYVSTSLSAERIAEILTSTGLEVEGLHKIETVKGGLAGVVVGQVLTCIDHPDSDHLHITEVNVGEQQPLQIVCGAPNVAAGQKVLCATVGTVLYPDPEKEGFKIKKSKIRGVESLGMLCAEDELGIGSSHDGIMILPQDAPVGTPAKEYLNIEEDYLLEIGLTPNRADAMSHYGVARDLAAYLNANGQTTALTLPSVDDFSVDNHDRMTQVEVIDRQGAPRYAGITITDVKIGPSPDWMQNALRAIGLNPHNNLVDITNFVLHELGQPLHAFDADKIDGGKVIVRTCPQDTPFVTLDGTQRTLDAEDLMICSQSEPMCIAGVFGGLKSGVSQDTVNIFLESAYFNPVRIRKTARRHGLNTDASFRFERGIDPDMTVYALKRAAMLFKELAGGKISSEIIDIYPDKIEPARFDISLNRINALIGKQIPEQTLLGIISALDVKILSRTDDTLSVEVPPYRVDVTREADLAEDILRIYGYNNIEIPQSVHSTLSYAPKPDKTKIVNTISDMLSAVGYTEIMNNSLTRSAYYEPLESYKPETCVRILNPLSADLNVMRQTLLFGALETVALNANRRNPDLKLYEFGNCYAFDPQKKAEQEQNPLAPYSETFRLAVTVTGADTQQSWRGKSERSSFFTLRAAAEMILRRMGIDIYTLRSKNPESDLFDQALSFDIMGKEFMQMGVVARKITESMDIKAPVYFMEMDFDALIKATRKNKVTAEELSKYPEVKRDLALLVDKSVTFERLRAIALATERKLLKNVSLFDVYEGDKLPEGKKSYALSFILQDKTHTLTDAVIDKTMNNLLAQFEKQTGAQIR